MRLACELRQGDALAQRQPPTPEQRFERLERQVNEMQRQVFPKGRPADTAGFPMEPAATQSSVVTLDQRLDAIEKRESDIDFCAQLPHSPLRVYVMGKRGAVNGNAAGAEWQDDLDRLFRPGCLRTAQ